MDYLIVAKVQDPNYNDSYRYYYSYINGSDGSVIASGDFVSPDPGEEYNLMDTEIYFDVDNNLFYFLFVDDNDGTTKKLPVMVAYVGYDEFMQNCGGQA